MPPQFTDRPGPHPFFLPGPRGPLFAVYRPPAGGGAPTEALLAVPPFAEEMNRSRRMTTLQAEALADAGIGTLVLDPWGTGDSDGEFADARWEIWRDDVRAGLDWLRGAGAGRITVLGLRLGAALAVEACRDAGPDVARLVLWQPVAAGKAFLNAFLRIRVAAGLAGGASETTAGLRAAILAGQQVEVAGYHLAGALVDAIDAVDLAGTTPPEVPIHWIEVAADPARPLAPASARTIERWREAGARVEAEIVHGEPFWSYQETTLAPALIARTTEILAAAPVREREPVSVP